MNSLSTDRKWHGIFWMLYFIVNHLIFSQSIFNPFDIAINLIFILHNAGAVYVTLDYWMPALYKKRQYLLFLLATIVTCLFFCGLLLLSLLLLFKLNHLIEGNHLEIVQSFYAGAFWSQISAVTLIMIPNFVIQRIEMERRTRQLEKEKLESELKYLKSQLHPHFLFNALNNIYFLIKKDPDTAAEALAGFSNLLRFQLYEANQDKIPLIKEIEYLKQYADIAQLRKGDNFQVIWQVPNETEGIQIPPLLLMPLLENAFKHGSTKNGQIDIELAAQKEQLYFKITNTKGVTKSQGLNNFKEQGIGLANIKKRLELLYPKKHELHIEEEANTFGVELMVSI